MNMIGLHPARKRRGAISGLFTGFIVAALLAVCLPVRAAIVFEGSSSARNTGLPTNGTAGAVTLPKPAVAQPGMAMIVSIAARPNQMTWTPPVGWTLLSVASQQPAGGVSTSPGGMEMRTYYRIVDVSEPNSYTWTLANVIGAGASGGGSAVGGLLVYSGLDTATSPLDAPATSRLNASTLTFRTNAVTTVTANAEVVSMIGWLSAGQFANPTCNPAVVPAPLITERLDARAPAAANDIGTTLQMSSFRQGAAGLSCAPQAVVSGAGADTGVGHLMALRPSLRDLTLSMTRSGPLVAGGSAAYTMTATNAGSLSEPGPLTIVNTLPAGLTYASSSGLGWVCGVVGQVVTCQKSGAIAVGASATSLVINVTVAVGVSGVVTNSATVSGTGGDGNNFNNTAVDSFAILPSSYAYYAFDENAAWGVGVGAVPDSSGNPGRNATALAASVVPTFYPPASPPGPALSGTPGTCGAAKIPAGTGAIGINTGIDVNNIGNAGTIAFWYQSSESWSGTNRVLLDASNELGAAGGADKHFMLIKDNNGSLRFALEDSADTDAEAQSPSYSFAADTWHHVVVTWDMAASRLYIFLDGNTVPIATSVTALNGTLGNMATLYLGAQRFSTIAGAPGYYTNNTLNGYLDEVRIYSRALAPLEVAAVYNLRHACSGTPSSAAANFNIVDGAYANKGYDAAGDHNIYTKLAGWDESANSGAGGAGNSTFTVDVVALNSFGTTETNYVSPSGADKSVSLQIIDDSVGGTACNSSAITCSACSKTVVATINPVTFSATHSGYRNDVLVNLANLNAYARLIARIIDDNPTPTVYGCSTDAFAVRPVSFSLIASSASNVSGSGAPAFKAATDAFTLTARASAAQYSGRPKINVTAVGARDTALVAGVTGTLTPVVTPIEAANQFPSTTSYANAPPILPTATDATASFTYSEAGSFQILDKPASVPTILDTTLRGLYDDIWTLVDQGTSGDCVVGNYSNTKDANGKYGCLFGNTASSAYFGRFIPDRFVIDAATSAIVNRSDLPATATTGTYSALAILLAVTAGTGTNFAVGDKVVVMGAGVGGGPLVTTILSSTANNITLNSPLVSALAGPVDIYRPADQSFTYIGEPMLSVTGLKAVNGAGTLTKNYTGYTVANWIDPTAASTFGLGLGNAGGTAITVGATSGGWSDGVASLSAVVTPTRGTTPTGPFPVAAIGIAPKDPDGVALAAFDLDVDGDAVNERKTIATTALRYGRIKVTNAFGSDKLDLPLPAETQYWNGNYWETNLLDVSGTKLTSPSIVKTSGAVSTTVSHKAGSVFSTTSATPGKFGLTLSTNAQAAVDLTYTVPAWLQYPWSGGAMVNPSAKASFGLYSGSNRFIYRREMR